jgi:3-hydroxyisobutyrate dehydrogenase-like beta-hydroxyacid dehydrogenase
MAERLAESGRPTHVFDINDAACARLRQAGAIVATSCADLAAHAELIGICVRDDGDVRRVVLGAKGLLAGVVPGAVLAVHSTVLPRTVQDLEPACRDRGVQLIDAPVTGGAIGAAAGSLCTMIGGEASALERYRAAAECFSATIVHTGALGSGATAKLCNNLMLYLSFLAVAEATTLAEAAGLSRQALEDVTGCSGVLTEPMRRFLGGRRMALGNPGDAGVLRSIGSFADLAEKDLALTLAHAREYGLELPGTGLCQRMMYEVYGLRARREGGNHE